MFTCSCFLYNMGAFIGGFLALIVVVVIFNFVIFVVVIFVLIRKSRNEQLLTVQKNKITPRDVVSRTIGICGIMSLFGLSWIFGALTINFDGANEVRNTFQILFTIFTVFQGFFIFTFFCALNKEVRDSWKKVFKSKMQSSLTSFESFSAVNKNFKTETNKSNTFPCDTNSSKSIVTVAAKGSRRMTIQTGAPMPNNTAKNTTAETNIENKAFKLHYSKCAGQVDAMEQTSTKF